MGLEAEKLIVVGTSRLFADDMEVCAQSLWQGSGRIPRFGDTLEWDLTDFGRPANRFRDWGLMRLSGLSPSFNLLARELAFCMLNPTHPVLRKDGVFLPNKPNSPDTVCRMVKHIRFLQAYQEHEGLPANLGEWTVLDLQNSLRVGEHLAVSDRALAEFALWLRTAQRFGHALTGGFPMDLIWSTKQVRAWTAAASKAAPTGTLKTQPIPPSVFYPLMGAAIAYVETFADDILNARKRNRELTGPGSAAPNKIADADEMIQLRLNDPDFKIPLHSGRHGRGEPNYRLLSLLLSKGASSILFNSPHASVQARRQGWVQEHVKNGRGQIGAFPVAARGLGSRAGSPWHDDFDEDNLVQEIGALRTACYIVVAATTLMRDSEVQEIRLGSLVDHYGAPAIRSVQVKHRPDRPELFWWLHPIGATAIKVAEQLTDHPTHIFAPLKPRPAKAESANVGFAAAPFIRKFVAHVNRNHKETGLQPIATHLSATPRQFRKTMAIQVGQQPGGELALGVILKHVSGRAIANASTYGYAAPDSEWMADYESTRLQTYLTEVVSTWESDFEAHRAVAGPGQTAYNDVFDEIAAAKDRPMEGDRAQLVALLRAKAPELRVGTFNHCMGDVTKARCLNSGSQHGVIDPFKCEPSKCGNSVITLEHIPMLQAELDDVRHMLKTPKISSTSCALLEARQTELESMMPTGLLP